MSERSSYLLMLQFEDVKWLQNTISKQDFFFFGTIRRIKCRRRSAFVNVLVWLAAAMIFSNENISCSKIKQTRHIPAHIYCLPTNTAGWWRQRGWKYIQIHPPSPITRCLFPHVEHGEALIINTIICPSRVLIRILLIKTTFEIRMSDLFNVSL